MRFQDLKLRNKQWFGFGAVLIAMAGVSFFAISQMNELREEIDEINSYWIPGLTIISELNQDVSNLRIRQLEGLLVVENNQTEVLEQIIHLIDSINANMDAYEALANDSTNKQRFDLEHFNHYENFDSNWDDYQLQYMNLFAEEGSSSQDQMLYSAGATYAQLNESLEKIISINESGSAAAAMRARVNFIRTRGIILIVLFVTIAVSSLVVGALIRSLTTPIRRLESAAKQVSQGDLSVRISVDSQDEIGNLSRSFNEMTDSLLSAQHQLLVREKMASLGQLTAGIAHEIKNPLNFVNNFATLTCEMSEELRHELTSKKDQKVSEVIAPITDLLDDIEFNTQRIVEHGKRADSIVRNMLMHSRRKSGDHQNIAFHTFLDEHINLVQHSMRSAFPELHVAIERNFNADIDTIRLIPQDIGRVFINVLSNAYYAMSERELSEGSAFSARLKIDTRTTSNLLKIDITDNGNGIPESAKEKVFEPFFTTKPTGEGTGLGLSLSYDIITQGHRGRMSFTSTENEGTTFTIELPIS